MLPPERARITDRGFSALESVQFNASGMKIVYWESWLMRGLSCNLNRRARTSRIGAWTHRTGRNLLRRAWTLWTQCTAMRANYGFRGEIADREYGACWGSQFNVARIEIVGRGFDASRSSPFSVAHRNPGGLFGSAQVTVSSTEISHRGLGIPPGAQSPASRVAIGNSLASRAICRSVHGHQAL